MWDAGPQRVATLLSVLFFARLAGADGDSPWAAGASGLAEFLAQAGPAGKASGPAPAPPAQVEWATNKQVDFHVACMLMGSVAMVMMVFYFLNCRDLEIQDHSWNLVSKAIVTFCGVMVTNSWNGFVVYAFFGNASVDPWTNFYLFGATFLGWYMIMQVVLGYLSGAIDQPPTSITAMVFECKCSATLMGMITGNSSMSFWALLQVQLRSYHRDSYAMSLLVVTAVIPLMICSMLLLYFVTNKVRKYISMSDDGRIDAWEELWDKFTEELESGALTMTTAHLTVQAIRFSIAGHMPQYNGSVQVGFVATREEVIFLAMAGWLFAALIPMVNINRKRLATWRAKRFKTTFGNAAAFCALWSTNWYLGSMFSFHGVVGGTVLALISTAAGLAAIVVLVFLAEMECTGEEFDMELREFIPSISVFVGFAWKQAFTNAVKSWTTQVNIAPTAIETLGLAVCVVGVVLPGWRMFILPNTMQSQLKDIRKHIKENPGSALAQHTVKNGLGSNKTMQFHSRSAGLDQSQAVLGEVSAGGSIEDSQALIDAVSAPAAERGRLDAPLLEADSGMADISFARYAGHGGANGRLAQLEARNRELELALAHVAGICSAAGGAKVVPDGDRLAALVAS